MYRPYLWPCRTKRKDHNCFYRLQRRHKFSFPTWWEQGRPREHRSKKRKIKNNQTLLFRNKQFTCKTSETLNTVYADVFYTNPYGNSLHTKLTNKIQTTYIYKIWGFHCDGWGLIFWPSGSWHHAFRSLDMYHRYGETYCFHPLPSRTWLLWGTKYTHLK